MQRNTIALLIITISILLCTFLVGPLKVFSIIGILLLLIIPILIGGFLLSRNLNKIFEPRMFFFTLIYISSYFFLLSLVGGISEWWSGNNTIQEVLLLSVKIFGISIVALSIIGIISLIFKKVKERMSHED